MYIYIYTYISWVVPQPDCLPLAARPQTFWRLELKCAAASCAFASSSVFRWSGVTIPAGGSWRT